MPSTSYTKLPNLLQDNWSLNTVLKGIMRGKGTAANRKLLVTTDLLLWWRSQLQLWILET